MTPAILVLPGGLEVQPVFDKHGSADAEALLVPQDVHRIMSDMEDLEDSGESPNDVVASCLEARPQRLGSLIEGPRGAGRGLVLEAVVYDFDRTPPVREDDVFHALVTAFETARARKIACLAVRPLGTEHRGISEAVFLKLLVQVCRSAVELGTSLRCVEIALSTAETLRRFERLLMDFAVERAES